jgi:hypothetical protein
MGRRRKEGAMPKEIVVASSEFIPEDPEQQGLVQVSWTRAPIGEVQVVTFARHPETFEEAFEGLYVNLDREGINQVIRNLRRARDQAFGRDE